MNQNDYKKIIVENYQSYADLIVENEYKSMYPEYKHITPKQLKANKVKAMYGYEDKQIKDLTSKQLGKILIRNYEKRKLSLKSKKILVSPRHASGQ